MPINASFPSKGQSNPFAEQLDFFRKKLNLPTERWDDIMRAAHDRAFVVAGAGTADLLNDLRGAVDKAIAEGGGLEAFRKDFAAIVQKNGWTGWTGEGTKAGVAWRTRVIYQTNMSTSYAAGRWKQLNDPALLSIRPFWRYVHADGVAHPRPLHEAWHGMVLRHDDPFWLTHFPPNGWFCHCRVTPVDAEAYAAAQAVGKGQAPDGWDDLDPKTGAPVGIDKGFDYAPGANTERPLKEFIDQRLIKLDAPVGSALYGNLQPVLQAERDAAFSEFVSEVLADPVAQGRVAIVGAMDRNTVNWLTVNKAEPATAEIALADSLVVADNDLAGATLEALPVLLDAPVQILFDTGSGNLVYIVAGADLLEHALLAIEFEFAPAAGKGALNMLRSAVKIDAAAIAERIKTGAYLVVQG